MPQEHDAVIIGAGLSGLTRAFYLRKAGWRVRVLEASGQTGGAIRTFSESGYQPEAGPNSIQVAEAGLEEIFRDVGLYERRQTPTAVAANRFIIKKGKPLAVPSSPQKGIFSPLFPFSGKLRVLKEPFIKAHPADSDPSLAEFAQRRLGQAFLDYALDPMVAGIYAGSPDHISVRHAFPKVWSLEQNHGSLIRGAIQLQKARKAAGTAFTTYLCSFPTGMCELPDALAQALGDALELNTTIERLERAGELWKITYRDGDGQPHQSLSRHLILSVPAFALGHLPLPADVQTALAPLAEIPYPSVTAMAIGFERSKIGHALNGFGALVPAKEKRKILGVLFSSSLFPGRAPEGKALLSVFIGGSRQPELADLPDDQLSQLVLADLRGLLDIAPEAEPDYLKITRWPRAIPQYNVGHQRFLDAIAATEQNHHGLHIAGNYAGGVALGKILINARAHAAQMVQAT